MSNFFDKADLAPEEPQQKSFFDEVDLAPPSEAMADFSRAVEPAGAPQEDRRPLAARAEEAITDFAAGMREGIPGYGLIERAGAATAAGMEEVGELFGGDEADFADRYQRYLEQSRREDIERQERSPIAGTAGMVTGAFAAPMPGGAGLAGMAGRTGINVADAATRARDMEEAEKAAGVAGTISAGMEGVGKLGKAAGAVGRGLKSLVPGTEGALPAVNRVTAQAAKMTGFMPNASKEDIYRVLADTETRKVARGYDLQAEAPNITERLTRSVEDLDETVRKRFDDLEEASLQGEIGDAAIAKDVMSEIGALRTKLDEGTEYFSPEARQSLGRAEKTIEGADPYEAVETAGKKLEDLPRAAEGISEADRIAGGRVLRARRAVDDITRDKDFKKKSLYDRKLFLELRDVLDSSLKEKFSGKEFRKKADQLYETYKQAANDLLKPLSEKTGSGRRQIDVQKVESQIKSQTSRGTKLDNRIAAMEKFLEDARPQIGALPQVREALDAVKQMRQASEMNAFTNAMNQAAGGPTSQAVNMLFQTTAGTATGGASLLALPVTNPVGWARIVDAMGDVTKRFPKYSTLLGESARRGKESLALTHYLLIQQDPEYKQAMTERLQ